MVACSRDQNESPIKQLKLNKAYSKSWHTLCDFCLLLDAYSTKDGKSHSLRTPKTNMFRFFTSATVVRPILFSNRSNFCEPPRALIWSTLPSMSGSKTRQHIHRTNRPITDKAFLWPKQLNHFSENGEDWRLGLVDTCRQNGKRIYTCGRQSLCYMMSHARDIRNAIN